MSNCLLCQKQADLQLAGVKDYFILKGNSPEFQIFYCPACKIAYSLPLLSDQELAGSYPDEYEAFHKRKSFQGILQTLKYKSDLRLVKRKLNKEKISVFEIGAGRGEFLAEAKKFGFKVNGLEPSKTGRVAAQTLFNIKLDSGYADELNFSEKYEAIIARHVFEHLGEPVKVLTKIKAGLADGGILFLKLPRLDSWEAKFFKKYWHGYDLPRHRFHYSKDGIIKLLKSFGFNQIEVISEQVPSDIIRSMKYYSVSKNNFLGKLFKLYLMFPDIIKLILAQLIAILLLPFKSGRMVVVAKCYK